MSMHPKSLLSTTEGLEKTAKDLRNLLHDAARHCASHNPKPPKTRVPWWNEELEELNRQRQAVRKLLRASQAHQHKLEFKELSRKLKSLTTKAHRNHFSNICRKIDKPWNLYNLLNKKRRRNAAIT